MSESEQGRPESGSGKKEPGVLIPLLLSLICAGAAISMMPAFTKWDAGIVDAWMRLRYALQQDERRSAHSEITVLAVDSMTLREKGAWGKGDWMTRKPFADQMRCFNEYFQPTVIAYDFLFQNALADDANANGVEPVSLSTESLARIGEEITRLKEIAALPGMGASVPGMKHDVIREVNRLSVEQGDHRMRAALASLMRTGRSAVMLAYSMAGGAGDPENQNPAPWSSSQVVGPDGDPEGGTAIPYLNYMAIPDAWIEHSDRSRPSAALNANMPSPMFVDYVDLGYVNVPREVDGVLRRVPLVLPYRYQDPESGQNVLRYAPSFALAGLLRHLGVEIPLEPEKGVEPAVEVLFGEELIVRGDGRILRAPIDDEGFMYLNYTRRLNDFDALPLSRLSPDYEGTTEAERDQVARYRKIVDDRIVVVAPVATALGDIGPTAIEVPVPLVYIHLVAMANMLDGDTLSEVTGAARAWVTVIMAVLLFGLSVFVRRTGLPVVSGLLLASFIIGHYLTVHYSWVVLPFWSPVLHITLASFAMLTHRYFSEERSRRTIRRMFSTMVSDQVLEYLEENPDSFSLAGRAAEATVFFSDVAGFTKIGEALEADRLALLMNRYMTPVTNCILEQRGYLDKYIGDGIMAVWGVPFPASGHAADACVAALEQQRLIHKLNEGVDQEFGVHLHVRMGLHTGLVTAGNMGSERRFQYTVMGDTVNVAARIEAANKDYDTRIIVSAETVEAAGDGFLFRQLDRIRVVGREQYVSIYELMAAADQASQDEREKARLYEAALDHYFSQEWDAASDKLDALQDLDAQDGPAEVLRERIRQLKQSPPSAEWDGVHVRETK